ncbi:unnamed protein product, partial [Discosporangium mesarthrocarpum]
MPSSGPLFKAGDSYDDKENCATAPSFPSSKQQRMFGWEIQGSEVRKDPVTSYSRVRKPIRKVGLSARPTASNGSTPKQRPTDGDHNPSKGTEYPPDLSLTKGELFPRLLGQRTLLRGGTVAMGATGGAGSRRARPGDGTNAFGNTRSRTTPSPSSHLLDVSVPTASSRRGNGPTSSETAPGDAHMPSQFPRRISPSRAVLPTNTLPDAPSPRKRRRGGSDDENPATVHPVVTRSSPRSSREAGSKEPAVPAASSGGSQARTAAVITAAGAPRTRNPGWKEPPCEPVGDISHIRDWDPARSTRESPNPAGRAKPKSKPDPSPVAASQPAALPSACCDPKTSSSSSSLASPSCSALLPTASPTLLTIPKLSLGEGGGSGRAAIEGPLGNRPPCPRAPRGRLRHQADMTVATAATDWKVRQGDVGDGSADDAKESIHSGAAAMGGPFPAAGARGACRRRPVASRGVSPLPPQAIGSGAGSAFGGKMFGGFSRVRRRDNNEDLDDEEGDSEDMSLDGGSSDDGEHRRETMARGGLGLGLVEGLGTAGEGEGEGMGGEGEGSSKSTDEDSWQVGVTASSRHVPQCEEAAPCGKEGGAEVIRAMGATAREREERIVALEEALEQTSGALEATNEALEWTKALNGDLEQRAGALEKKASALEQRARALEHQVQEKERIIARQQAEIDSQGDKKPSGVQTTAGSG